MNRYFVRLSYDGTAYHGWQTQPNARSVQQVLSEAFSLILRKEIKVTGCGRTDTGVHALVFYAHFDLEETLDERYCSRLAFKLNRFLNDDIAIHRIFPVRPNLHSRFSARRRTYRYILTTQKDPFLVNRAYYRYGDLNLPLMNEAAGWLTTVKDFTSFSKVDSDTRTNLCHVTHAAWKEEEGSFIFTITADRFLRNMVRAIVGTLVDLGTGKITLQQFKTITGAKNRCDAGDSVPACGLYLAEVEYPGIPS